MNDIRKDSFNKKYFVRTYGCQLNENDSEKISGMLESMGYTATDEMKDADIIVFNTCTIRENANDKIFGNLGIVNHIKKKDPDKVLVLCGCMMKEDHNKQKVLSKYKFVDIIFGPADIHKFPQYLHDHFDTHKPVIEVGDEDFLAYGLPVKHKKKFRALSTIIYGCNNFCTYCIVPYVRGKERSRDSQDVLDELKVLGDQGYKEVMLLGQNVNSYGKDKVDSDFADLLDKAGQIETIKRIRFMTSHPKDISRKLIDVMAIHKNIMPHIHLPLQSGSDRILKLMNRGYTTAQYYDIVLYAREKIPGISITTDIIVGFPGETEEDFAQTLDFLRKVSFDSAFTFQYSKRSGTPAADFEGQVPEDVVTQRFQRLLELQNSCTFASNKSVMDTLQEVLVEGTSESNENMLTGRTPHNRLVNFPIDSIKYNTDNHSNNNLDDIAIGKQDKKPNANDFEGMLALVKITDAKTFSLEGEFIKWVG
jgi:tRNA-2-methylthio-N6-dimethylallyladenosine synthase